jgi:hypothetical protein
MCLSRKRSHQTFVYEGIHKSLEIWSVSATGSAPWRRAEIINELGDGIELKLLDASRLSDLENTISTTRQVLNNSAEYRFISRP